MKKEKGKRVISAAVVLASTSSSKKKDAGGSAGQTQSIKAEAKTKKTGAKPIAVVATAGAISKRQFSAMDFPDENLSTFVVDRSVHKVSSISMQPTFQEPNCIVGLETASTEIKPSTDQGLDVLNNIFVREKATNDYPFEAIDERNQDLTLNKTKLECRNRFTRNKSCTTNILKRSWRLGNTWGRKRCLKASAGSSSTSFARSLLPYPFFADIAFGYLSTYSMEKENDSTKSILLRKLEYQVEEFKGNGARHSMFVVRSMGWALSKVWRRLFSSVEVDENNILACRQAAIGTPMVLLPSHKSHVDYLMMSYICFAYNLPMPIICAGENLNIPGVGRILRYAGCFFMKRSFRSKTMDKYRKACSKYVNGVLRLYESRTAGDAKASKNSTILEFFMEGGRSRHGKLRKPRLGMLSMIMDAENDCTVAPVALTYDMIPEMDEYIDQLLGKPKQPESLTMVLKIMYNLFIQKFFMIDTKSGRYGCGNAYVRFAPLHSLQQLSKEFDGNTEKIALFLQSNIALASVIPYTSLVATVILMERFSQHKAKSRTVHGDTSNHQQVRLNLKVVLRKVLQLKDIMSQIGANMPLQQNVETVEDLKELLSYLDYEFHTDTANDSDIDDSIRVCMTYIELPKSPKMVLKLAYLRNQLVHFFCGMFNGIERDIMVNEYPYGVKEPISVTANHEAFLTCLLKSIISPYREAYACMISYLPFSISGHADDQRLYKPYIELAQSSIRLKLYAGDIVCHEALASDTLKNCSSWFGRLDSQRKRMLLSTLV